ncbi:hypothetical protein H1D32_01700 [Anaerobacillus sp. CMMVII]|uniref:hypothetical protein n=1 Tax=Anaerobacillus sp. CMMVII TaxID=2755588 RepID=UPI0021B716B6|nr:hypothetical protein [Anaerobacillus sp. CMMVII]MCT8136581.1 hypothetical protein [Anaerobacillus sp. CMMVII]
MVNQDFEKFKEVSEKHKSVYLGGEKARKVDKDVLQSNENHGTSVGAEGRDVKQK